MLRRTSWGQPQAPRSCRPHRGGLLIHHVHHGEAAQKLLGLDMRTVGHHHGAIGGIGAVDRAVLLPQRRRNNSATVISFTMALSPQSPPERARPA